MPSTEPSDRKRAIVAGLQWGLTQAFVLGGLATLVENYYRATVGTFEQPGWVFSVGAAVPVAFVVGWLSGYQWVRSGRAAEGLATHRARVRYTGVILVGWALAIVPVMGLEWALGDRLYTVPWFLLPSLVPVSVLAVATYLGYRTDGRWYARHRGGLLGSVQGALCGLLVGMLAFVGYGWYLQATRDSFGLDGGPLIVVCVCLGALAGYALADRLDASDRAPEFVTLLVLSTLGLSLVAGVVLMILQTLGVAPISFGTMLFYPTLPVVLAFLMTVYLTYGERTDVYAKFVGRPSTRE